MGVRQWVVNWLEASRTKNESDRQTNAYPFPFGVFSVWVKDNENKANTG
jgi:hypothetical protein